MSTNACTYMTTEATYLATCLEQNVVLHTFFEEGAIVVVSDLSK